jgi:hypothetical protein
VLHEILLTIEARAGTFFHASQSMLGTPTASHAAIPYVSLHPIAVQLEFMHQAARSRDLGPGLGKAQHSWIKAGEGPTAAPGSARASVARSGVATILQGASKLCLRIQSC